jgi:hypothetical protein
MKRFNRGQKERKNIGILQHILSGVFSLSEDQQDKVEWSSAQKAHIAYEIFVLMLNDLTGRVSAIDGLSASLNNRLTRRGRNLYSNLLRIGVAQ